MPTDRIYNELFKELKKNVKHVYKIIETPNQEDICERTFNEFSENGWELVTIADFDKSDKKMYKLVYRRIENIFNVDE